MSAMEVVAAKVLPPMNTDVGLIAVTTSAGETVLQSVTNLSDKTDWWKKRYVSLCAAGGDVYVTFSVGAGTAITVASGWPLKDGVPQDFFLSNEEINRIQHIAATVNCSLYIYPSG